MADNQIVLELILDDGQVVKALGRVRQEADKTKKNLEEDSGKNVFSKKIGDISVGVAALGVAALKTFSVLSDGLKASVAASRESAKSISDLSTALAVNGKFSERAISNFKAFASTLENQTGINDDIIIQNASLLASVGRLSGEGLERATKAAVDLSAATGRDLGSAFRIVSQAAEGNTEMLKRYGISVDGSLSKSEKFEEVLRQLGDRFGGLAAARADTFEGAINQVDNALDGLAKTFGNIIVESPVARNLIKLIADVINEFAQSVSSLSKGDVFGGLIKSALPVARAINEYLLAPIEGTVKAFIFGLRVISTAFLGLGSVFAQVGKWLNDYLIIPISEFFGNTLVKLVGVFDKDMAQGLKNSFDGISSYLTGLSDTTATTVGALYQSSLDSTLSAANGVFEANGAAAIDSLLKRAEQAAMIASTTSNSLVELSRKNQQEMVDNTLTIGSAFENTLIGMDSAAKSFAESGAANFQKVGQAMFQSLGTAAGQAFASFGRAVASGENALDAFLKSLLASFGQMAIQLGTQFMLQGAAYLWAGMPNGAGLIAAGAALAAFGGILSAVGGGGGASAPAASGGGASGVTSSVDNPTASLSDTQSLNPQSAMTVNIQGDVLDSEETGSRIINMLTQYSDRNGNGAVIV